jgi:PAS domain S-box-containing protein
MATLADLIKQHREQLLHRYREEAGQLPSARELQPEELLDNLPEYLATLSALSRNGPRGDLTHSKRHLEEAHLGQRLRMGYSLDDVTAEYVLLGRLLARLWEPLPPGEQPSAEETLFLFDALQAAREHAVTVFHGTSLTLVDEECLRLAVRATGLGIWDYDPIHDQARWDARGKALFGLPPDAPMDYATFLAALHPEDRERVHQQVQQALAPSSSGTFQAEYRTVGLRDGIERWVAAHGQAFFDVSGRAVRFLGTLIDITERKRRDEERERLLREHQRVVELVLPGSGIIHGLRLPLSTIILNAQLLLRLEGIPELVLTGVRRIARGAERMARMITVLLGFTQARLGGGIPLDRQPTELVELVRTTIEQFEMKPGRVVFTSGRGPYVGEWDPYWLAQVIFDLVVNPGWYGARDTQVEVALREEGPEVVLSVSYQGSPIHESLLPHLFDPFRPAAHGWSEGLWLYFDQQLVLAHGGTMSVSSSAAAGTTFTIRLPMRSS